MLISHILNTTQCTFSSVLGALIRFCPGYTAHYECIIYKCIVHSCCDNYFGPPHFRACVVWTGLLDPQDPRALLAVRVAPDFQELPVTR